LKDDDSIEIKLKKT